MPISTISSSAFLEKLIADQKNKTILKVKVEGRNLKLWCDESKFDNRGIGVIIVQEKNGVKKE